MEVVSWKSMDLDLPPVETMVSSIWTPQKLMDIECYIQFKLAGKPAVPQSSAMGV